MGNITGDISEMLFQIEASKRSYIVGFPHGQQSFDCFLDNGKKVLKIQIKSSASKWSGRDNAYKIVLKQGRKKKKFYGRMEVDVFAVFIIPENTWFLIPFDDLKGTMDLTFYMNSTTSKWNIYKDNWDILRSLS